MKCFIVRKWVTVKESVDCGKENMRKKIVMLRKMTNRTLQPQLTVICIVYNESSVNLTCHTSNWVIDSGASFHVTAYHDYFTSYINDDYGHVWMGNEGASKIVGI